MKFKKQHIVTASYLKEWCDPNTPDGYTPYVWLVSKDGLTIEKKAPTNIFNASDFYTILDENGNRNLELEHYLHKIEDDFLIARKSIQARRPISDKEVLSLALFIASTYARTELQKREQKEIWSDLLNIYQLTGIDHRMPDLYKRIQELEAQPLLFHIFNFLNLTVPVLYELNLKIIEVSGSNGFITSDNPVLWLDPSLWLNNQPVSFFGLESPYLEIILPLSPNLLITLNSNSLEQYTCVDSQSEIVDVVNNMIVNFSDEYVVMNHNKPNPYWFK